MDNHLNRNGHKRDNSESSNDETHEWNTVLNSSSSSDEWYSFLSSDDDVPSQDELPRVPSTHLPQRSPAKDIIRPNLPKKVHFPNSDELAEIREFPKSATPEIPQSAFAYLRLEKRGQPSTAFTIQPSTRYQRVLVPRFDQPCSSPDFMDRVNQGQVCLENVVINGMSLIGYVRTRNLDFEKHVQARYTFDAWVTTTQVPATYVPGSSDGWTDKFKFEIAPKNMREGDFMFFVVRYVVNGEQFFDNNYCMNYCLVCELREEQ